MSTFIFDLEMKKVIRFWKIFKFFMTGKMQKVKSNLLSIFFSAEINN